MEMDSDLPRIVGAVLVFLVIMITGIWLSRNGRPLNVILLTIHKLMALGAAVFLAVSIYRTSQEASLTGLQLATVVIPGLLFVVTGAVGGLLSTDTPPTTAVQKMHKVTPVLTVLSTAGLLYLLHGS
jgi:hypothetical protein